MNKFLTIFILLFFMLNAKEADKESTLRAIYTASYKTQNDVSLKIPQEQKLIIIAFDKANASLVNEYLDTKEPTYLQNNNAVFIADVSDVPNFLLKMVALPKLKKFKHTIYLNADSELKKSLPQKEGKITLLYIQNGAIMETLYISSAKELEVSIQK